MRKQKTRTLLAGLLLVGTLTVPTFAFTTSSQLSVEEPLAQNAVVYADEFTIYYRTYNGINQYRVWNITKSVWVTPWTNVT